MLVYNGYDYILIGLTLRILRNVNPISGKGFVSSEFNLLFRYLEQSSFQVSLAYKNSRIYKQMEEELSALSDNEHLSSDVCWLIERVTTSLEDVIFAESSTKKIYVLPDRRYNADYLLNDPGKLLKKGTFEKLDAVAQKDIASACKCLLFGEATAAAFHILRATESVLKSYYFLHRKQQRLPKPMWANMIDQLKSKQRNKPPATLLSSLDLIRTAYRNPTQHPEAIYEIDNAQDLFGVCLDVIGKMGDEF